MLNQPQTRIEVSHDLRLESAREAMKSFLINEGLNAKQAGLVVEQVMTGNPAKAEPALASNHAKTNMRTPAIHVLSNATAQAQKVESALAALSAALDPYMPTSLSIERTSSDIAYSLVPWGGREDVEKALLDSKFISKSPTSSHIINSSVHISKTAPGHVSIAASREILRLDLHRTAAIFMRQNNLYPPTTFPPEDERIWSERLLAGGTASLPVRNKSEPAKQFYEQFAQAALSDAQALRGVIASSSIEWKNGKTPALLVRTGIPESA